MKTIGTIIIILGMIIASSGGFWYVFCLGVGIGCGYIFAKHMPINVPVRVKSNYRKF